MLQSVGPKGARYEDVLLDFRDRNADPARGSVLFLENGGGKSVLLKLLFSVLLPGRKLVLGANSNTKTLENFVLTGDTGHVVLEWRAVTADGQALPERLLTGKVYEWRGRQHSSDSQNLREAWYTLRPADNALTLDTLPVRAERDGSKFKRQFGSYKEKLEEANRAHPELDLVWTDVQRKWIEHLDARGIDPELFKYQREMNADEGDADEVFAFRTHEAFIDFLLEAVTGREGPNELATNVDRYAEKLRNRERLQLEQTFVDGALDRLRPLAAAAERHETAAMNLRDAQRDAEEAHGQFAAAAQAAADEHERLQARAEERETSARTLDTRSRELQEQLRELRRRAAQFRLDAAEVAFIEAEAVRKRTQRELAAWRAAEPLAAQRAATAHVKALEEQLAEAEREATPLLERRAVAARGYAGALLVLIDDARAAAQSADTAAVGSRDAAKADNTAAGAAREDTGRLRAEASAAQSRLDAIEAERDRLIVAKFIARGQSADEGLAALDKRRQDAERRERETTERIVAIDARLQTLAREIADASVVETRATEQAARLDDERSELRRRAERLADSERVRELASVEQVDLWRMADPLRQALVEAAAKTERDTVILELEAADDRHAARALEETGRLPAARDAKQAVEALRSAGVPAVSGWDYLAESVRAAERESLLRRVPELVGGIILTNPAHRERAEAALVDAALEPTTVITLGDSSELVVAGANGTRERFVVAPNAALYDEEAGEDELELRAERLAHATERRRELDTSYRRDHDLRHEFEAFLADCPAGRLDELAAAAAKQRTLATETATGTERARNESASLTTERPQREAVARTARADLNAIAEARARLEGFRERADGERELRETIRRCGEEASAADAASARHARAAHEHGEAAQEATRLADEQRRRADSLGEDLQKVEGAGEDVARRHGGVSIEELRGAYVLATRVLDEATTGSELAAEHRRAQTSEAEARARLEEHGPDELTRAAELLATATDRPARREGERRAQRNAEGAEERRAQRRAEREACQGELDRATPRDESGRGPRAQLTGELIPSDLDHALALHQRLDAERVQTLDDQRTAAEAARQARERATKAESRAQVIGSYADSVATAVASSGEQLDPEAAPDAASFPGSADEAKSLMRQVTTALQAADSALDRAETQVRDLAEHVSRFALDDAFEAMAGGNLRERLARDEAATLARRSSELIPHLQARAAEVAKELASIEQHRLLLLQRLAALVQAGLNALRQAGRASRLPADLGDWSGKQFLRIDFETPDSEDVLLERLGEVLDSAVSDDSGDRNRDGMTMLLRGVRAAADPHGFRVTVLKPDAVLRDERVPVTAMGEFSGGQRLTASIALYCTLAAMRSTSRGRQKPRAGVLFLDNPIGTASAEYLLDIQLKVADRVGVQLVYTTGVFDTNALSKFPCVLRLRNDLDMRAGLQRIRVADSLRTALLNGRSAQDGHGYLDVARVVHERSEGPPPA
ncbi:MAG: coiled-coil domain-containing protein [Solirubrobacteraceae bacterium]